MENLISSQSYRNEETINEKIESEDFDVLVSPEFTYEDEKYRVILDETTTTPELVDRNIMYAKVFLKPARAIEYIAIDFVITRTGASFDD